MKPKLNIKIDPTKKTELAHHLMMTKAEVDEKLYKSAKVVYESDLNKGNQDVIDQATNINYELQEAKQLIKQLLEKLERI